MGNEPIASCPRCAGEGILSGPRLCRACGGEGRVAFVGGAFYVRQLDPPARTQPNANAMLAELAAAESV